MGLVHKQYLDNDAVYCCSRCKTHLTTVDAIISRQFQGKHGKAYLFQQVINVYSGPPEERIMTTGLHIVRDIMCNECSLIVGWTYVKAYEESQKYKEGRFILERNLVQEV
ncbi:Yippee/Mis18 [Gorgonomyces haynaldii]|nr:Yippee/Mis18 [Gorgonomyces haynaldii]